MTIQIPAGKNVGKNLMGSGAQCQPCMNPTNQFAVNYAWNMRDKLVAPFVFPIVPRNRSTGKYKIFDDPTSMQPGGSEWRCGERASLVNESYREDVFDLRCYKEATAFCPDEEECDDIPDLQRRRVEMLTRRALGLRETEFFNRFFTGGQWGWEIDGTVDAPVAGEVIQWSDYANSTPVEDISCAVEKIANATGLYPNRAVAGHNVFQALRHHPEVLDKLGFTVGNNKNREIELSQAELLKVFELEEMRVSRLMIASQDAPKSLTGTKSLNGCEPGSANCPTGKNFYDPYDGVFFLYYAPNNPSVDEPSAGYMFAKTMEDTDENGFRTRVMRDEKLESTEIDIKHCWDMKKTACNLGYLFKNVVDPNTPCHADTNPGT